MMIRHYIDYTVQFYSPHYRNDIGLFESVQSKINKRIQVMRDVPYEVRWKLLNLYSSERHRLRGDLIEVFKCYKGLQQKGAPLKNKRRNNGLKLKSIFSKKRWEGTGTQIINCQCCVITMEL